MKDFISRNFAFLAVSIGTLVLIIGGVFLFSKNGTSSSKVYPDTILNPSDAQKTGGIQNGNYIKPSALATVTMVEFGDFQCPACGAYHPLVKQVMTEYAGKVNFVFRNFPLPQHSNANISAYGAEAAGLQGKYWQMYSKLYESQDEWSSKENAKDLIIGYAKDMGLNLDQFKKDIDSQTVKDRVTKDTADGNLIPVNATPTFFVNGVKLENPGSADDFKKVLDQALKKSAITQTPAPVAFHGHFDLKVYMNNKMINFGLAKYQSAEGKELDPDVHIHDGNGNIVHLHKEGVTLAQFFKSLKMTLSSSCFIQDNGQKFCNTNDSSLKMYVNGQVNTEFDTYIPKDLDRIVISFGPNNDKNLTTQINSVTDMSCIYSEKCPERGKAPTENCVGGVGTDCTKQ